jgi:hypothetical protein
LGADFQLARPSFDVIIKILKKHTLPHWPGVSRSRGSEAGKREVEEKPRRKDLCPPSP